MKKTILITGSTDGLGLETARALAGEGHEVLLHGRSPEKLADVQAQLGGAAYAADLSSLAEVERLARAVERDHARLDVLINNAGVFKTPGPGLEPDLDVRFVVNAIAPYHLTLRLLPRMPADGRVVNLSSAAQAPVDARAFHKRLRLSDGEAYAQSKLALTMWSRSLGLELGAGGPMVVAVNPKSFLGTKMVRDAYGSAGSDVGAGVDVLRRAALSEEFADAGGRYFDNDRGSFAAPHPDALDPERCAALVDELDALLARRLG